MPGKGKEEKYNHSYSQLFDREALERQSTKLNLDTKKLVGKDYPLALKNVLQESGDEKKKKLARLLQEKMPSLESELGGLILLAALLSMEDGISKYLLQVIFPEKNKREGYAQNLPKSLRRYVIRMCQNSLGDSNNKLSERIKSRVKCIVENIALKLQNPTEIVVAELHNFLNELEAGFLTDVNLFNKEEELNRLGLLERKDKLIQSLLDPTLLRFVYFTALDKVIANAVKIKSENLLNGLKQTRAVSVGSHFSFLLLLNSILNLETNFINYLVGVARDKLALPGLEAKDFVKAVKYLLHKMAKSYVVDEFEKIEKNEKKEIRESEEGFIAIKKGCLKEAISGIENNISIMSSSLERQLQSPQADYPKIAEFLIAATHDDFRSPKKLKELDLYDISAVRYQNAFG